MTASRGRVLIVDDNELNLRVLSDMLERSGYEIMPALRPDIALDAVQHAIPDVILLDVMMPEMDGYELCRRIHSNPGMQRIPVLFISAATDGESILKGFEAGAVDYIAKPFQFQEVLARVRTHMELHQTRQRLAHSEKMAAIGQLAAGTAHEINNLLAYVLSNLNTLNAYGMQLRDAVARLEDLVKGIETGPLKAHINGDLAEIRKHHDLDYIFADFPSLVDNMRDGLKRVAGIVRGLRDFAHPSNTKKAEVDIVAEVSRALELAQVELKYVGSVRRDLQPVPLVSAVASQLGQVFVSILVNAAQILEGRSDGVITVSTSSDSGFVRVRICDNGNGIDPAIKAHIFDPFFTTKDVGKGTGMGLSIAHSIIVDHAGTIEVESEKGTGTCFLISLPELLR